MATYVGIAGGCDIPGTGYASPDYGTPTTALVAPVSARNYFNRQKGIPVLTTGIITASGMLPVAEQVGIAQCQAGDGTSNTMIVAEQSDWLQNVNVNDTSKYHGDPGWNTAGSNTATGGGFLSGTTEFMRVPLCAPVSGTAGPAALAWGNDAFNVTTVRYRPNYKKVMPAEAGCAENHGINNPLGSAHPGGLLVAMTDGSVQFISQTTDLAILLRLAIRDDGQNVNVSQ
jgi:hypothetical protein